MKSKILIDIKIVLFIVGIGRAQGLVQCSNYANCSGSFQNVSKNTCCNTANDSLGGVAYMASNSTECIPCPKKFGFSQPNFFGYEQSEPYSVEVGYLQGQFTEEISFTVILHSSMISSYDVLFINNSFIEINQTNPTAHLYFVLSPDGIAQEFNETFFLRIVDISSPLPSDTDMVEEMSGLILDNDEVEFKFQSTEYVAIEGENEDFKVHISKTPGIRLANPVTFSISMLPSDEAISVNINGILVDEILSTTTRTDSDDFGSWNSTQIFEADEGESIVSSIEVLISIRDDLIDEFDEEYFAITFDVASAVNLDSISLGTNLSICKIIDNDVCNIGFDTGNDDRLLVITEPDIGTWINDTIYIVKNSNCLTDRTFYVGVTTTTDSSATLDTSTRTNDYNLGIPGIAYKELIIPPDEQNVSFDFYLNSDNLFEGDEAFDIVLFPIKFDYFRVSNGGKASVIIRDNDHVMVGFEKSQYTVNESSGGIEVCVNVVNPPKEQLLLFNITLTITQQYMSAGKNDVFGQNVLNITFPRDEMRNHVRKKCINISLINDQLPECTEDFELLLSSHQRQLSDIGTINSLSGLEISPRNATITIEDDDVKCQDANVLCFYDNRLNYFLNMTSEIECCSNTEIINGISFRCEDEDILYACPVVFGFTENEMTLLESDDVYGVTYGFVWGRIDGLILQAVLCHLETGVEDVTLSNDVLTFTGARNFQTVNIRIEQDNISQEYNETFNLKLMPLQPDLLINATVSLEMNITIVDTTRISFRFPGNLYNCRGSENETILLDIVKLSGASLANNVTFEIRPSLFTLTDPNADLLFQELFSRYASQEDIRFMEFIIYPDDPTNQNESFIYVPIIVVDDDINEYEDQRFFVDVYLTYAVNVNLISLSNPRQYCDIHDNDPIYIGFEMLEYTVSEKLNSISMYNIAIIKEGGRTTEQVIIFYVDTFSNTPNLAAIGSSSNRSVFDRDFSISGGFQLFGESLVEMWFSPLANSLNVTFTVYPDEQFEGSEQVHLCIGRYFSGNYEISPQRNCTVVNILDESKIAMGFSSTHYSVNESSQGIDIPIELKRPTKSEELAFTINFVMRVETQTADPTDFVDSKITTKLLCGQFPADFSNNKSFPKTRVYNLHIDIQNDNILEENESFKIQLEYDPFSPPISIDISPNETEVLILDGNEGIVIGFLNYPHTVNEGTNGTIRLGIISGGGIQTNITVLFHVLEIYMSDILGLKSAEYVFNAEHSSYNITFNARIDNEFEVSEELVASLSLVENPASTRISIYPSEAYIAINSTDTLYFDFSVPRYTVSREEGFVKLAVIARESHLMDYTIVLQAETKNGTAFSGTDFNYTSTTLQFNSSTSEIPLYVPILERNTPNLKNFTVSLSLQSILINGNESLNITERDRMYIDASSTAEVIILSSSNPTPVMMTQQPISPVQSESTVTIVVSIVTILASIIFVTFLLVVFCLIYLRIQRKKLVKESLSRRRNTLELTKVRGSFRLNIPKKLIINSCNLKMSESVGQGQFGIVYKGYLSKGYSQGYNEVVAVKTLKGFFDKSLVKSLLEECSKMAEFDHPNVLPLTGVCLDGGPVPYIVMPFMFNGSLWSYLVNKKEEFYFPSNSVVDERIEQASVKLIEMCFQVTKGMEYLASKRVVHRDLATRNCMVDMSFVIKVCDFGLSQTMNSSKDYFREEDKALKLPFKWMAPESLDEGVFSTKTDVWSYGVTCWEVFSCGKAPYPGVDAADLSGNLQSGYRMDKPLNAACSDIMYCEVLRKCWELKPEDRPNFSDLVSIISGMLESSAGYLTFVSSSGDT